MLPDAPETLSPESLAPVLLPWYDAHGRTLPWRGIGDPWAIWVSEVMMQQTRVETGLKHWDRFIARFPTVQSMAESTEDEVLAQWSGLGFYRRARNLHRGACLVVADHGGVVPTDPALLGALPGVGRYTVGAILSAAHDARLPILDGNVIRLLSRLFVVDGAVDRAATKKRLWGLAEAVLPAARVGDFNQALMDFGSQHCSPTSPRCDSCPLRPGCGAYAAGRVEELPVAGKKARVVAERRVALLVERADGSFVVEKRPSEGLLAGLWQLPSGPADAGVEPLAHALGVTAGPRVGGAEHRFSHRHWTIDVYATRAEAVTLGPTQRWVTDAELGELALPTASRKALDAARSKQPQLL